MNWMYQALVIGALLFHACGSEPQAEQPKMELQNKGHEIVYAMMQKVGDYADLIDRNDVVYTYTYSTPDGKTDVSTEKYLFDGELSYGKYNRHERTLVNLEGPIEQGYDGTEYWLKHNGAIVDDSAALRRVAFNRPTNFYWFAMFQKMMDPGLKYEHLGEQVVDSKEYDIVKVSFTSDKPTDIYQLYINKRTMLVDQFLFTVADFGRMEIPNLMRVEYENVDGIMIPTKRRYKRSTWDAEVSDDPWVTVVWSDIQFDNGLSKEDFAR